MSEDGIVRYGLASDKSVKWARRNFASASFDAVSLCCTPVEVLTASGSEDRLSHGSGFFWQKDGVPYLVTNWHVVSGRNPFTNDHLDGVNCTTPHRIKFAGRGLTYDKGELVFQSKPVVVSWGEDMIEMLRTPPVVEGEAIDIWATPVLPGSTFGKGSVLNHEGASRATCYINESITNDPIKTGPGSECFILGYPLENYEGLMVPIWKRGAISSETNLGVMEKPIFLIDAATTEAMSGSPVIRRVKTGVVRNADNGLLIESYSDQLIGVYAGRLKSKALDRVNIGYAWYSWLIDEVIDFYNYGLKPN